MNLALLKKHALRSLAIGTFLGIVVAATMTALDWWHNPGGIFQNESGSNWSAITDTFVSWMLPVWCAAAFVTFIALALFSRARPTGDS